MIVNRLFVEIGSSLVLRRVRSIAGLSWAVSKDSLGRNDWAGLTAYIADLAKASRTLRVYLVVATPLHFEYDVPAMEDDDDLRAAVNLKLKRELIVPMRDFIGSMQWRPTTHGVRAYVAGVSRKVLAQALSAVEAAECTVQRVYSRDQLIGRALTDSVKNEEAPLTVVEDGGYLAVFPEEKSARFRRVAPAGAATTDAGRRLDELTRLLARESGGATLAVDDCLCDGLSERGVKCQQLSSRVDGGAKALLRYIEHPEKLPRNAPFAALAEEHEFVFKPQRSHIALVLVSIYLLWTYVSLSAEQERLNQKEAALSESVAIFDKANQTMFRCQQATRQLKGLERAMGLFDSEGYTALRLVDAISRARPDEVRIETLKPRGEKVTVSARAPRKQSVFEFVDRLGGEKLFDEVNLRELDFGNGGEVVFVVELLRNG